MKEKTADVWLIICSFLCRLLFLSLGTVPVDTPLITECVNQNRPC